MTPSKSNTDDGKKNVSETNPSDDESQEQIDTKAHGEALSLEAWARRFEPCEDDKSPTDTSPSPADPVGDTAARKDEKTESGAIATFPLAYQGRSTDGPQIPKERVRRAATGIARRGNGRTR